MRKFLGVLSKTRASVFWGRNMTVSLVPKKKVTMLRGLCRLKNPHHIGLGFFKVFPSRLHWIWYVITNKNYCEFGPSREQYSTIQHNTVRIFRPNLQIIYTINNVQTVILIKSNKINSNITEKRFFVVNRRIYLPFTIS